MNRKFPLTLAILLAGGCATLAADPEVTLKIGDPAPKLQTGDWVQGTPVKSFEKDKAYIVEFWATWCPPCRVSIPHLNEIHQKFKDKGLVVIGQDCWERDDTLVKPFVEKMGDKMTYRVAMDDKSGGGRGKMAETWMTAAGQSGIPTAFVVGKDAKIAWIGHPMTLKDTVIEQVLAGKFDTRKAAEEMATEREQQAQTDKLSRELNKHMQAKDYDKAEATLDEIAKTLPAGQEAAVDSMRMRILMTKGDYDAVGKLALKLSDAKKDNAEYQNELAWNLATAKGVTGDALKAAATIAQRADAAANGKDANIIDTLARVAFLQGEKEKAIELQTKALAMTESGTKGQFQKTLDSYKEGKLPTQD